MMGWQWRQLDHMQIICTSLQTENQASTSPLSFFTGLMPFLPLNQQRQSTDVIMQRNIVLFVIKLCHRSPLHAIQDLVSVQW